VKRHAINILVKGVVGQAEARKSTARRRGAQQRRGCSASLGRGREASQGCGGLCCVCLATHCHSLSLLVEYI